MVNDFITRTFPLLHYIVLQAELELSAVLRELELASIHQELFELLSENPQLIDEFDENPEEHERKAAALRPRSKQMGSRHM
ncbi:hypothetical protein CYG49_02815 [Candidatus Saccharibacteria bacterium]|nr:MAG: hypothetical protein CYG49_02815 [Candidatus Saccharibacteria bacterium]